MAEVSTPPANDAVDGRLSGAQEHEGGSAALSVIECMAKCLCIQREACNLLPHHQRCWREPAPLEWHKRWETVDNASGTINKDAVLSHATTRRVWKAGNSRGMGGQR